VQEVQEKMTSPWIQLIEEPIDTAAIIQSVATDEAGAALIFLGTTRKRTDGRETASLDYSTYRPMALSEMKKLAVEATAKWPLIKVAISHRVGHLEVGEASVVIAVSAPHRKEAFAAGEWLIDTLKEQVPIWKKENWADGQCDWVHPGLSDLSQTSGERVE
jgi:molybdopterin synthase catalytic subunit